MRKYALAAVLLAGFPALADITGASPRTMFVEAKLSPYTPRIDDGYPDKSGPYYTVFMGSPMLMGELEFDYEFFQKFGSLGVGASVGYAEKYAKAFIAGTAERADQSTGFHVLPLKLLLVYRFDWLFQKYNIPFVPYVKGGGVLMPWWGTKGPEIEVADSLRGAGYKLGVAGVAGLAMSLDFLDQRLARDFDTGMGVNHTYLFAEVTYQYMAHEFSADVPNLNLSSLHAMFGLGFEF